MSFIGQKHSKLKMNEYINCNISIFFLETIFILSVVYFLQSIVTETFSCDLEIKSRENRKKNVSKLKTSCKK